MGSNLGDRGAHLRAALERLARRIRIDAISSVWETEPVDVVEQPRFWNLVVRVETDLPPATLLAALRAIEVDVGRTHSERFGPREIDIDLLLYDELTVRTDTLEIPHPRMTRRAFVLEPLAELAPGLAVTGTGRTVAEFLAEGGPFEEAVRRFPGSSLLGGAA